VSRSTLLRPSQHLPNGHGNGSAGAAFFRTYQGADDSTIQRHSVMTSELNFAEIGHGRGTINGYRWADGSTTSPQLRALQEAVHQALGGGTVEGLPRKLKLRVQSIKVSFGKPHQRQFSVKFTYGNKNHTTLPTTAVSGDEHTWFVFRPSPPHYRHSPSDRQSRNLVGRNQ